MPKETWIAKQPVRSGGGRASWRRRIVWTLAVLGLVVWLGWLLVRPFLHPRTHLVLLTGDVVSVADSPDSVAADFVVEDLRELLKLENALHLGPSGRRATPLVLGSLHSAHEMQHLADRLNECVTGRSDVMLIYVSAHGLTQDDDAWLLASGADPKAALGGVIG